MIILKRKVITLILKPEEKFKRAAITCVAVSNTSSIPLFIAEVLFYGKGPLSELENAENTLAYNSFYIVFSELVIWLLVKRYMAHINKESIPLLKSEEESEELHAEEDRETRCSNILKEVKEAFLNVPVILAFVGIIIGLISPLRNLFFGPEAPLSFVMDLVYSASAGTVSTLILVLGISFSTINIFRGEQVLEKKMVALLCAARLVVIPAILTGVVFLLWKLGAIINEASLVMVLLIQSIPPTNIRIILISKLEDHCVKEVSLTIFWMYLLCLLTLPVWLIGHTFMIKSSWWFNF